MMVALDRILRPAVRALAGYTPGEQPPLGARVIKLNTNENPYPPSPKVIAALAGAVDGRLRLYPDPAAAALRARASEVYGVPPACILVGNGSDELLTLVMRACVGPGDRVAFPVPTYSLYETLVAAQEGVSVRIPFPADFAPPVELGRSGAKVVVLCQPNSPSGTAASLEAIEALVSAAAPALVVCDEAYVDFGAPSALPLLAGHDNLVVLRSFSKSFSLAGIRVGLAFGHQDLIAALARLKDSYNVDRLAQVAAQAALEDIPWMETNVARIRATRETLASGLRRLGFVVVPSSANFVLARRPGEDLGELAAALAGRRILVRHFATHGLRDALRITVGTDDEVDTLLHGLRELVASRFRAPGRSQAPS